MAFIDRGRLKKNIHSKFGSLINFSKTSDIKYNTLLRILNTNDFSGEEVIDVQNKYVELDLPDDLEGSISASERQAVRRAILFSFNSYTDFCNENTEYDVVYITNIVKGNLKRVTTKYSRFINLLKQKYNYDKFIT